MPSVEDGFEMVMAQAMACGLPVIATTNISAEDLFTDGVEGFIVPIRIPRLFGKRCYTYMKSRLTIITIDPLMLKEKLTQER